MIDLQTLYVCIMHILLFYSAAYILFWFTQKTYNGFGSWTLATICYSCTYGAVLLRLVISEGLCVSGVILFTPLASMLYADAILRFTKDKVLPRYVYLLLLLVVSLNLYFYYINDNITIRYAILLLSIAPFNFIICRTLFLFKPVTGRILYLIGGMFFLMRFVGLAFKLILLLMDSKNYNVFESPDMGAYLLFNLVATVGVGLFFFMIHALRSQEELYKALHVNRNTMTNKKVSGEK